MPDIVLDASAVLACLRGEPGGDAVGPVAHRALISAVNFAEVLTRLIESGVSEDDALSSARLLRLTVRAFDDRQAASTAALRPATRHLGLSLGDRACLALALAERLPVLTADRAWASLGLDIEVKLIR